MTVKNIFQKEVALLRLLNLDKRMEMMKLKIKRRKRKKKIKVKTW